ncbi:UNVERIFIED_CONTAM: ATP-binding cassette G family transporter ABCG77 [Hammondia hammondi]|eukprot:XP_008883394.1 ATP-binding cassette G family transporter ABCG77 [Hammondia hammondi]
MPSHPNLDSTTPPVHYHSGGQPMESLTSICQKKIADDAVPVEKYWSTDHLSPVALDRETTTVSEPRPIPPCHAPSTIDSGSLAAEVRNSSASRCGDASPPSPENGGARSGVVQVLKPHRVVTLHKEADSLQMKEAEQAKRAARLQVFIRFTNLTYTPPRGLARQSVKEWAKKASCTQSSRQGTVASDSVSGPCSKMPPPSASAGPRQILFGLSGYFAPGEIVGILGPSGAGKSTFLSVLCGRLKKGVGGLIEVNGEPAPARMKKIVGYVMQQEYFFGNLTVEETLMYTARLRLGKKTSFAERKARVEEVINSMKLNKCRGTRVGSTFCRGLSGGELKRLNIANELLLHPSLFLLDEPTSGLDASISAALLDMLKQLTRANRCTTVCTIHQPNSNVFMRFDRVIFLKDGHIVYQGKPSDVCAYFSSLNFHCPKGWNIADYAMHVISAPDDENFRWRSLTCTTAAGGDPITGSTHGEQVRLEREPAQRSSALARYRIDSFEASQEVGIVSADASSWVGGSFACRAARTSSGSDRTRETNLFGEIIGRQTREDESVEAASELSNGQQPGETEKDDDKLTGAYGAQPDFSAAHGLEAVSVVEHFCDGPLRPPEESTASALSAEISQVEDVDNHFLIKAYQRRINRTTFQLRLHDLSTALVKKDPSEQKVYGCKAEDRDSQKCDCDPIKDYSGCGSITQHDATDALLASRIIKSHMFERKGSGEDEPGPKSGLGQRRPNTLSEEGAAAETSMNSFDVFTGTAVEATHEHMLEPLNNKANRQNVRSLDLAEQIKSISGENLTLGMVEKRNILSSIHSCGCGLNRSTPQRNTEFSAGAASPTNAQAWPDKLGSFPAKKMECPGRKFSKRTSFLSFDEEIKAAMSEPSYFQQVWVLICRGIRKELKGKSTTLDLVQAAVIGAVVGSLYFQSCRDYSEENLMDRMGLLYFTTSYYSFGPAYMAFTSFPAERAVISRERSSKAYRVSCYLLAKTVIDLVVQIFTPSLWLAIVYPLVGLPSDLGVFMAFWAQLVLLVCIAQAIGQLVAAIVVDDARLGGLLLSVILISSSISSGFYVQQQRLGPWISWLRWLSFQNYAVTNFVIVTVGPSSTLSCSEFSSFPTCPGQPITAEMITRRFTTALSPVSNITLMMCTWLAIKLMCYGVLKKSLKLKS